ncbi:hypothetical protein E2C01_053637 [Portunus trituberculatus]|uniref:Uncharacterized protein n=1 Tax=Portunus trituberculatus TaxID=210409 RepID=A0A5B7GSU6_PORTR|nr:hypothetical protein [Portunus trituberculatus]
MQHWFGWIRLSVAKVNLVVWEGRTGHRFWGDESFLHPHPVLPSPTLSRPVPSHPAIHTWPLPHPTTSVYVYGDYSAPDLPL